MTAGEAGAGVALPPRRVTVLADLDRAGVEALLAGYGVVLLMVPLGADIPGSHWGDSEAGLKGNRLYARPDTPIHSLLHEVGHYVCMEPARRERLDTDAGGGDEEEAAVCYLQVLLADELGRFGRAQCLADMDEWGYSFREGSAQAWLVGDARFARVWLNERGLIDAAERPTRRLRA